MPKSYNKNLHFRDKRPLSARRPWAWTLQETIDSLRFIQWESSCVIRSSSTIRPLKIRIHRASPTFTIAWNMVSSHRVHLDAIFLGGFPGKSESKSSMKQVYVVQVFKCKRVNPNAPRARRVSSQKLSDSNLISNDGQWTIVTRCRSSHKNCWRRDGRGLQDLSWSTACHWGIRQFEVHTHSERILLVRYRFVFFLSPRSMLSTDSVTVQRRHNNEFPPCPLVVVFLALWMTP